MKRDYTKEGFNLDVVIDELSGSKLVEDYQQASKNAIGFYAGDWRQLSAYKDLALSIDNRFSEVERERAFETLRLSEEFPEKRRISWIKGGGLVVTTGQQPGLFCGPLYTLYKALSAIQLAKKLEVELGRVVVPVFWIASEDHDWEEVRRTYFVDREDQLVDVALEADEAEGQAIHSVQLKENVSSLILQLSEVFGVTDFSEDYLNLLRDSYSEGTDLGTAMADVLLKLLGPRGLAVLDSNNAKLKSYSRDILLGELKSAKASEKNLNRWSQSLIQSGYHLQVPLLNQAVNLFLKGPLGRERLYRSNEDFSLKKSNLTLSTEDIIHQLEKDQSILSPNVLLRPIVEASILPVVSYVAGPGELAYYAQIKPLYEYHSIDMPLVYPRHSATLIEKKITRKLTKFNLTLEDSNQKSQELFSSIAQQELPVSINSAIERWKEEILHASDKVLTEINKLDPTLEASVVKSRNTALASVKDLNHKIIRSFKRKNEETLKQIESIRMHLFPGGSRQERILNPFLYLARYGEQLIEELIGHFRVEFADDEDRG
tara:strand:+ start:124 stop:1758 length:1635 start_codon:yes stop_codon:yes gene_type:complete